MNKLIVRSESGRLILEKQEMVKKRLKERFRQVSPQRSLAKELIDERREAASKEISS